LDIPQKVSNRKATYAAKVVYLYLDH